MKKTRNKKGKKKGQPREFRKGFLFLTDLPVSRRNVEAIVMHGRMRWKIENEGFNTQKKHGYCLEYQFSRDYQAQKCHYYLIQTDHMVAQVLEAWGKARAGSRSTEGCWSPSRHAGLQRPKGSWEGRYRYALYKSCNGKVVVQGSGRN